MRQAGLKVPGTYGPAKEEWGAFGMETPAVYGFLGVIFPAVT